MFQQCGLDLAQLDAQAAQLHLMVDTAQVLQHALFGPTRQVATAIQTLTVAEGAGDEALCGQPRTTVVTARQADTADIQLPCYADGLRVEAFVEDMNLQVGNRSANRHAAPFLAAAAPVGDVDGRFGRAIQVVQLGLRQQLPRAAGQLCRQRFAAADDTAQALAARQLAIANECRQHGRHEVQGADALARDQLDQLGRVAVIPRLRHHQARTADQRPEEFPHRHVETERGLLQHPIVSRELVSLLHPGQAVVQRRMAVAGALGLAGGAGGVDQVGQLLGVNVHLGRGLQLLRKIQMIEIEHLHATHLRQAVDHRIVAQQQADAGILEHVAQTFGRIFRVHRHVGAAGLEDGVQRHHHLHRTQRRHAHQTVASHATLLQMVSQLVGAQVQLDVAQPLLAEHQGDGLRLGLHAFLELTMHRLHRAVIDAGGIEAGQGQTILIIVQTVLADGQLRLFQQLLQQADKALMQALDRGGFEQIQGVVPVAGQLLTRAFPGVQGQVELRAAAVQGDQLGTQFGRQFQAVLRALLVVVQHLEQRVMAEAALGLQRLDQLLEGQRLIRLGALRRAQHLRQQCVETLLAAQLAAQHLGVDEEADQPLCFALRTPGNGHADTHVALAAQAMQQHLVGRQQHGERRATLLPRQLAHARGKRGLHAKGQARATKALLRRTRMVAGQLQQRLLVAQLLTPVGQLPLAFTGIQAGALPQSMVGVAQRQLGECSRFALHPRAVELRQLGQQQLDRPAVGDDVVQTDQQYMPLLILAQQADAPQRRLFEVERALGELTRQGGKVIALQRFQGQCRRRVDALARVAVGIGEEARAQARMTLRQIAEGAQQRSLVQWPLQLQGARQVIGAVARLQLFEEPQALLRVGQHTALGIGRSRRNRQCRGVEPLLAQLVEEGAALLRPQAEKATRQQQGFVMQQIH